MIVDSHVHVVSPDQERYPLAVEDPSAPHAAWVRNMAVEELLGLMEGAGIDKTVIVQAFGAYRYDSSYATDSARAHPHRAVSVCCVDPAAADAVDRLRYWAQVRGARGLRLFIREGELPYDDPRSVAVLKEASAQALPVCVVAWPSQLLELRRALEQVPGVTVALDHLAFPDLQEGPPYSASNAMWDLAELPNVYMKFSSVTLAAAEQGKSSWREFFPRLVDRFGAHRLVWGSNFPATSEPPLKTQLQMAREAMDFLSTGEQDSAFGGTALALWPELASES